MAPDQALLDPLTLPDEEATPRGADRELVHSGLRL
jgi:hypothetical protein